MASQANTHVLGQPPASAAGLPQSTVTNVENFKNVTRNNGVFFRAADNVSIQAYIDAFITILPAKNVISASRISNGRIAVYLSSKEAVVDAVQKGLTYGGSYLELTPLVRPTTRFTLSNVYPEIPNSVLVNNLSPFCKVVSQIRPIPLGLKDKHLNHIMSFRRQVQVLINPNVTPPDHINFFFSGTNYRVFLSTESVRCFNCGEFGHISRSCKKPRSDEDPKPSSSKAPVLTRDSAAGRRPASPPRASSSAVSSTPTSEAVPAAPSTRSGPAGDATQHPLSGTPSYPPWFPDQPPVPRLLRLLPLPRVPSRLPLI